MHRTAVRSLATGHSHNGVFFPSTNLRFTPFDTANMVSDD
jgi:hypothetical protein